MNRSKLKAYAPKARRDFIRAVTDRAAYYGLTKKKIEPVTEEGDVAIIAGKPFPRRIAIMRAKLVDRIKRQGFEQVMEAMAYTWFNRMMAIRFMELHGYLEHGYRVLSSRPVGSGQKAVGSERNTASCLLPTAYYLPEIIENAEHVDLQGLDKQKVIELKLDGTKESELYNMLFLAQCRALHRSMPFLFEAIDDETELLLPENLLHSDSVIRKMVGEIDETDWQEVEIVGWLYQFYISEKKDEVIGKVVKSEDIPAATQLFTPNWIVKYLVQNSLGRQWVATYPDSPLKAQMEYYIEPAEQTPEVQEQLKAITPTELNPEKLTLLDPACGSGHILVEAYDLLKLIYQERGYRAKDIPRLILEKNLYGLEIDDRAAQLAAFALMMKARADDRKIFTTKHTNNTKNIQPHVLAIQESKGLDAREITEALRVGSRQMADGSEDSVGSRQKAVGSEDSVGSRQKAVSSEYENTAYCLLPTAYSPAYCPLPTADSPAYRPQTTADFSQADMAQLIELFEHGKTFGSLIQLPEKLAAKLPTIAERIEDVIAHGGMFEKLAARLLKPLVEQARLLVRQYDAVVTNPPYMGSKAYCSDLKEFVYSDYTSTKPDLYACFMHRNFLFTTTNGFVGMITIPNWMFLTSFKDARSHFFSAITFDSLMHNGRGIFGSDFGTCSFVFRCQSLPEYRGTFRRLFIKQGSVANNAELIDRFHSARIYTPSIRDFSVIPEKPVAYWASANVLAAFNTLKPLSEFLFSDGVTKTGNNDKYLRFHWEVSIDALYNHERYRFCTKGGDARKYYGNYLWIVDWRYSTREHYRSDNIARITPEYLWDSQGITWSDVTISVPTFRLFPNGFIAETKGPAIFSKGDRDDVFGFLGLLNSRIAIHIASLLNPTVSTKIGDILRVPCPESTIKTATENAKRMLELSKADWDSAEISHEFLRVPCLGQKQVQSVREAIDATYNECLQRIQRMKELEEQNNRLFISAFGLHNELAFEVAEEQITLYHPDQEEDIQRLISYAIGCMMGRYSLDKPGLIYAHSRGEDFWKIYHEKHERNERDKHGNYSFDSCHSWSLYPPDSDGIIPITDTDWFPDDAANRFVQFIATAWPGEVGSGQKAVGSEDSVGSRQKAVGSEDAVGSRQKAVGSKDENTAYCPLPTADSSAYCPLPTAYSSAYCPLPTAYSSAYCLEENLKFVAESLGPRKGESSRETIRRYLSQGFYKHHLSMYKKRPIYWLFSSGKQRAFECLVYLHRYNEGTLGRMRTEYVIPLQGKIEARIGQLADDIEAATSTSHRNKLQKERDKLVKQQTEIQNFDEKLRHYADQRISLDLDDGVKVNYGKFGDLLAEVKAVTGQKAE